MSASLLVPIFSGIQRIQKGIALGDAPARVKTFVLGLSSQDGPLLEDFLQQPGNLGGWNAVLTTQSDISAVAELAGPMAAVAASETAMTAVAASETAMTAVAASETAMAAVVASQTAMTAVVASQTAMTAVAASETAMAAVVASETAMAEVAASETAMTEVAASETAMVAVAESETAQISISESTVAMDVLRDISSTADSSAAPANEWVSVGAASNGTVFVIDVRWDGGALDGTTELRILSPEGEEETFNAGSNWSEETPVGRAFTNLEIIRIGGSGFNRVRNVRYIPITSGFS